MAITTNRVIQVNLTADPTNALSGTKLSLYNGLLEQAQTIRMDAGVTGTLTVMQPNDTMDLDNNGSFESVYTTRFNFSTGTYTLSNGSTVTTQMNFIKVTTGGVVSYFLIIPDAIAAQLDAFNITAITPGGTVTGTPNTAGENFNDAAAYVLVCFAAETRILTKTGQRPIGTLAAGDLVWVKDQGFQPVKWVGWRRVAGRGRFAPIVFAKGSVGNHRALRVSPQHRMHVKGPQLDLMFGSSEALVAAQHLVGKPGVTQQDCEDITYVHLMFDSHCVISAEGALSESYFPGEYSLHGQDAATQAELLSLFPELGRMRKTYAQTCLPCLDRREARLLDLHATTGHDPAQTLVAA